MGGGVCFGSQPLSDLPNPHGNGQPQKHRKRKDDPNMGSGQELPNGQRESDQSNASHGSAGCIDTGCAPSTGRALEPAKFFFLLLVFLNEGCACREDRRKRQEQPANTGAKLFGNHSCHDCDESSKEKSNRVVIPLRLLENGRINFDWRHGFARVQ
jgi:hypothetical protein